MELLEKLEILANAAKYDVSCSSSGSTRKNKAGGLGNSYASGICHSWSEDGRCISLLKILLTNYCIYNCAYCVNRSSNDIPRAYFTPDEVAKLTVNFYRRNYIEGLFLSSAVITSPNHTMELLTETVRKLRNIHNFNGYIHLKAIPGADLELIKEAGSLVDRMSVNIELPSASGLKLLAPQKKQDLIIRPMDYIKLQIYEHKEERKISRKVSHFVPAGQTTQLIVGATPDTDLNILQLSEKIYKNYELKRVYYSAYVPVSEHPKLPQISQPPLLREHRLYQADWLLRFYGFRAEELLNESQPNFDLELDPKTNWALRNLHLFPVEINRADYETLLRVPGIGVKSAQRIIRARQVRAVTFDNLKKFGVVMKRAQFFITCRGKYGGQISLENKLLRQYLIAKPKPIQHSSPYEQLSLFNESVPSIPSEVMLSNLTGEL
ncbi:MAG: putative DNA modification/repair radical SAM protein [Zhaonellaceae bacterium]|nr:putative DNA modification/repair radical SAM protein [Clostridia bacterium]